MISLLFTATLLPFAAASDDAPAILRQRARLAPQEAPERLGPVPPGNLLFDRVGGDNAECVRAIPDVNGDGRDEIVVGIGQSGTDNVFCLDGASSGSANVVWSLQTSSGASGGSCYGDQSIVPVSDSDTSGDANVLLGTAWGGRTAFNFDTLAGGEALRFDTYLASASGWVYSLCEIGDVTSDGVPEVAFGVGSDNNAVYLVDGASVGPQADVLWKYPAGDAVYSVRNLGDVNADGSDDVLAAIGDDFDRVVCLEGDSVSATGTVLWTHIPGTSVYACDVLSDTTGDGVDEALVVLWASGGGSIRCLNGATGGVLWTSTTITSPGMQAHELDDITGDSKNEVIVSSWDNAAIVLDGDDGSEVWRATVGTTNGGDVWTARAIGDISGDGRDDVIAGSFDYHVYALDGLTGAKLWAYNTGNRVFSVAPVGDLNSDGWPEVAAGTQDTHSNTVVFVLEGDGGLLPNASFCDASDGSLASCPCSNPGAPDTGCDIAQSTGGVGLSVLSQTMSPGSATLQGSGFPPAGTPTAIVIRAPSLDAGSPVVFGDGLRCVGVPLVRLGAAAASGGVSTHVIPHGAGAPLGTNYYQLWFRNTPASFCDAVAAFNLSNGRTLTW